MHNKRHYKTKNEKYETCKIKVGMPRASKQDIVMQNRPVLEVREHLILSELCGIFKYLNTHELMI